VIDPDVLGAQREYYEQRAPEYDDWWFTRGRYDHGPEINARWRAEADEAGAVLDALDVRGDVLELAPGTGTWSRRLVRRADRLTLVDASEAMHAQNPVTRDHRTRVVTADLFEWDTDETFDAVVFGFWLSHVPDELLDDFLAKVGRWLRPGGRLFYVDSRPDTGLRSPALAGTDGPLHRRTLADGRTYVIVKIFRTDGEVAAALRRAGIAADVRTTATYFQYATGVRRP
jgi:demethylmenaquinone methyltransferase/2-methoxy-6-polyprenyl-1,4-benzoquinol methylase